MKCNRWTGLALAMAMPTLATAAAFAPGNLAVYRIGSGSGSLVNTGNPVFIDEYTPAGVLVQSIPLPSASVGAVNACVASGTASSEGLLTRSSDGRYLFATGYRSDFPGAVSLSGTTGTAVPRVAARIDGAGAVDTSTALTDFASTNNPRGAVSTDGTAIWVTGGAGGIRYATLGATTSTQLSTTVTNLRQPAIFDGQLYVSTSSGSAVRIGSVGSGTPTTIGQTITNLTGIPAASGSPYGYVLLDLNAGVVGVDTLYVADDTAPALTKYSLVGGTWTSNGVVGVAADTYRGLTATVSGNSVTLYATRKGGTGATGGGELVSLVDASGYNGAFAGAPTVLATAAVNTAFRGLALAPTATVALPDLTVTVSAPAAGVVTSNYDYTLSYANAGTVAAGAFAGTLVLPAGVSFVAATGQGGCSGTQTLGTVTFSCPGLAAAASTTATITVAPTTAGTITLPAGAAIVDSGNAVAESNEANNAYAVALVTQISNGQPPQIQFDAATTDFIQMPVDGPGALSGVIGDASDPGAMLGVDFMLNDSDTAVGSLTVSVDSSNLAVVPAANLILSGSGAQRHLTVTAAGVGYSTITLTVSDPQNNSDTYLIQYAASDGSAAAASTRWHTSGADASTAVILDAQTLLAAIDEDQRLRLMDRSHSGLPLAEFDVTSALGLTDISGGAPREVDIEASTRVGNRVYFVGSHSNSSGGAARPNRYRLFAVDYSAPTSLSYVGRYDGLRDDLIAWDSSNAHGLGANHFGLAASAAVGVIPEEPSGAGFNIEGLAIAPNGSAYLAFRAPIVPATSRTRALIVPINNLAALVSGNPSAGPASFGAPIQLDLGGRGIRSLDCNVSECLIIAGPASAGTFRLYTWNGAANSQPVERAADLSGLNPEAIVELPATLSAASVIEILSDLGDSVFYGDGVIAKDLPQDNWKKFRSDRITLGGASTLSIADANVVEGNTGSAGLQLTVSLSAAVSNTVTVDYASSDGTATLADADYQSASGTLSFAPGQTSATLTLQVVGDLKLEPAETVSIDPSNAQGASIVDAQALVTINNDDSASVAIDSVSVPEGNSGSSTLLYTVTLNGAVQGGFTLPYQSADGSATAGSDYTAANGTLNFTGSPGQTRPIAIAISGDSEPEADETFYVDLGTASVVGISSTVARGTGTLVNDDLSADVVVGNSNGGSGLLPGQTTTYAVTVSNSSAFVDLPAVQITQTLAPALTNVTWTCSASGGASCPAASGTGAINTQRALPIGASLNYLVSATVATGATGPTIDATVAAVVQAPQTDPNPANNSVTDIDALLGDPLLADGFE